jgi:hypothetical protein
MDTMMPNTPKPQTPGAPLSAAHEKKTHKKDTDNFLVWFQVNTQPD